MEIITGALFVLAAYCLRKWVIWKNNYDQLWKQHLQDLDDITNAFRSEQ